MSTFKVGDQVRCVDCHNTPLNPTEIYTVHRAGDGVVSVNKEHQPCWYDYRFELVKAAPLTTPESYADLTFVEPNYWPMSRLKEPLSLPTDSAIRKGMPIATGMLQYFPRAAAYVALVSRIGNDKHNPGEPLHWAKEKSTDHLDCVVRHAIDAGKRDPVSKVRESGCLAWRALANLEIELEAAEARGEEW